MQKTCLVSATFFSLVPTFSAMRPPIPVSTSSNIITGIVSCLFRIDFKASMMRESSPPDAILARGRSSSPGLGENKNSRVPNPMEVGFNFSLWYCTNPCGSGG